MGRTGHTGARAISPEVPVRLRWLVLVSSALALSQAALAQLSTDAGPNAAFTLPGANAIGAGQRAPAYTYGVDAGVGETDNVALTPTDKISQTIAITDLDFTVNRQSRLFDANAAGDFSYLDYLQKAFGNELLGRFDGVADAAIVPGRLTWTVRDDFGQAGVDPYTPVTPNNIESINYFTTGPELKLRFGGINFLDLSARYGRTQYQISPFNSNRVLGSAAVGREMSAGTSVSLNATTEHVMFADTAVNADFTRTSAFGRYELQGARTAVIADLGVSTVNQSSVSGANALPLPIIQQTGGTTGLGVQGLPVLAEPGGSLTGPLARLQLTRVVSPSAKVILTAGQILTDASSSFSTQTTGATGIPTAVPGEQTAGTYRATYASAGWQFQHNRTTMAVTGRWEKDVYPGLASLDVTMPSLQFNVQRRMTRALTLQVLGSWSQFHYPYTVLAQQVAGSTDFANSLIGASLIWRHGRGLEVRLRCDHESYTVSNGNTGYQETRAFLTVGYRPGSTTIDGTDLGAGGAP